MTCNLCANFATMETREKNRILAHDEIQRKVRRMAFEIYEQNFDETELVLAGIEEMGYLLAQRLAEQVEAHSPLRCTLCSIVLDKTASLQSEVQVSLSEDVLAHKTIILVDDVLNTGKTLVHSVKPFLKIPIRKLQVAVLVNRGHRSFPVSPDFVGYELSTTVNQHIQAELGQEEMEVFLF